MHALRRGLLAGILATTGLCAPAFAEGVPTGDPFAEFAAASEREKAAAAELERLRSKSAPAEQSASQAGRREEQARQQDMAALDQIHRQLASLFDRYAAVGQAPPALMQELAAIEEAYATYQRIPQRSLTETSFAALEVELDTLARAGLIDPGTRRFRKLSDIRSAIVAINDKIAQSRGGGEADRAAMRQEIGRLAERRQLLLRRMITPSRDTEAAARQWVESTLAQGKAASDRFEAQEAVHAAYDRYVQVALRQRPPALVDVVVMQNDAAIYRGGWTNAAGARPDEQARQTERTQLAARRDELRLILQDIRIDRAGKMRSERLEIAETMAIATREFASASQRYAGFRNKAAAMQFGLDLGLSAFEILATGGAATLARKSEAALANEIGKRTAARAIVDAFPPADRALLQGLAKVGESQTDLLARAGPQVERLLQARAPELERALMAQGIPAGDAARQVAQSIANSVARIGRTQQALATYYNSDALIRQLKVDLARAGGPEVPFEAVMELLTARLVSDLPSAANLTESRPVPTASGDLPIVQPANFQSEKLISEVLENTVAGAISVARARVPASMSGWTALKAKLNTGVFGNWKRMGAGVLTGAFQVAVAGRFDTIINAQERELSDKLAKLTGMHEVYNELIANDRKKADYQASVVEELAGVDLRIAQLDGGYTRKPTESRSGRAQETLAFTLQFSSPLTGPPSATIGGKSLSLQAPGNAGARWSGTISGATLGAGTHRLEVTVGPAASAHAGLDSNPETAPVRPISAREWTGFEKDADRWHAIRLQGGTWAPFLGRWTSRRRGGVVETYLEADGTISGRIVSINAWMRDNGYTAGMPILRGWVPRLSRGTWVMVADRGETFSAVKPGRKPGEPYGNAVWEKGGVIPIEVGKPDQLDFPATLGGRLADYDAWTRIGE